MGTGSWPACCRQPFNLPSLQARHEHQADHHRLPRRRAQDPALAGALANNLYLGRSMARSQQVDDAITALSLEQVNAALRKYFKLEDFQLIFAGDFK
jgi:zinc protease